jgi:hypothetical protein
VQWDAAGHPTAPEDELPEDLTDETKPPAPPTEASVHE